VTRVEGVDPAIIQALRALVSTDAEWEAAGEAVGNFVEVNSAGPENERLARLAAKTALELELAAKPTTIEEDEALLKRMDQVKSMDSSVADKLAVMFRIEKKKLLSETIRKLI
jgi:protein-tyrosine-phosphatase